MKVSRIRALRGPNLWTRHTALEAVVTCDDAEGLIHEHLPSLETKLRARFPGIDSSRADAAAGACSMAHLLQHTALALQIEAGCQVSFSRTIPTSESGVYQVVVEYSEEDVGRRAFAAAVLLLEALQTGADFDVESTVKTLHELDEDVRLGPSTGSIVQAALARDIPYRRLTQGSMVQFGWGNRQRRIQAAETDATSAIAESIAQDKDLTKTLLHAAGVPVPMGCVVSDVESAWAAVGNLGGRVVIKPRDGNQGRGVAVNLETREQVESACAVAFEISDEVIVERYLPGRDFRLLVVGDKLVAASRRDPPHVTGDGQQSIRQLIDRVNADPLRGDGHATPLTKIRLDDIGLASLKKQGYQADDIPPAGTLITLRHNANLSTGGSATDVTDEVHPELVARVLSATRMIGLDICGVDVVAETVQLPLEAQHGGIVEVNAAPGLRMHLNPSFGKGRAVGEAIIASMYHDGNNGRIPIVAVAGTNGKTTTVRLTAHLLATAGHRVGMTNSDGVYVGEQCIDTGDCSGPRSARRILAHPAVDAAVFETARGGILREGLAFDRSDVAIVTNLGIGDHLGLDYINTLEDLAAVKRVIVQHVREDGAAVLNAMDSTVAEMATFCPGSVIYFAHDSTHPLITTHRAQGHRVVYRDGSTLVAAQNDQTILFRLADIPLTHGGTIPFQVDNAMAAIAAAWSLGLPEQTIRSGLATFISDVRTVPGRFNMFSYRGATLIADYGHNPDAIQALVQAIDAIPAKRRSVVISGAGDRRDEDLRLQTEILGDAFDEIVLYEDQCQRGRADGEVLAQLRLGLNAARRVQLVHEIQGEYLAIDTALQRLSPGDVCLILVDQVSDALAHIQKRVDIG